MVTSDRAVRLQLNFIFQRTLPLLFLLSNVECLYKRERRHLEEGLFDNDESGKVHLGQFRSYAHGLAGDITLLDDTTLEIKGLTYDGEGPAAWFLIGKSDDDWFPEFGRLRGVVIPDDLQHCGVLKGYSDEDITLKLPGDIKFGDYNFISMYCFRFNQNFGYVKIPSDVKLKNGTAGEYECDQDDPLKTLF